MFQGKINFKVVLTLKILQTHLIEKAKVQCDVQPLKPLNQQALYIFQLGGDFIQFS